jgi:hypothetical protein
MAVPFHNTATERIDINLVFFLYLNNLLSIYR